MTHSSFNIDDTPHRRYNPLTDQWVLVSPHRSKRPWSGMDKKPDTTTLPAYDEKCFLCPSNTRISGDLNPNYKSTFVFKNDYSALLPDAPLQPTSDNDLIKQQVVCGESRVICFSPDHSKTLPELSVDQIQDVIETWDSELSKLGKEYLWVVPNPILMVKSGQVIFFQMS